MIINHSLFKDRPADPQGNRASSDLEDIIELAHQLNRCIDTQAVVKPKWLRIVKRLPAETHAAINCERQVPVVLREVKRGSDVMLFSFDFPNEIVQRAVSLVREQLP